MEEAKKRLSSCSKVFIFLLILLFFLTPLEIKHVREKAKANEIKEQLVKENADMRKILMERSGADRETEVKLEACEQTKQKLEKSLKTCQEELSKKN